MTLGNVNRSKKNAENWVLNRRPKILKLSNVVMSGIKSTKQNKTNFIFIFVMLILF